MKSISAGGNSFFSGEFRLNFIKKIADWTNPNSFSCQLRRKRVKIMEDMVTAFRDSGSTKIRILDVGGDSHFWMTHCQSIINSEDVEICLLNMYEANDPNRTHPRIKFVLADGTKLNYADNEFDIYFSNSTIEHVGAFSKQIDFSREALRVAKKHVIQTPNRYFILEPHFLTFGFQFLPFWLRAFLLSNFNLGWVPKSADYYSALSEIEQIRLMSYGELKWLFKNSKIIKEKILGMTKSFIIISKD